VREALKCNLWGGMMIVEEGRRHDLLRSVMEKFVVPGGPKAKRDTSLSLNRLKKGSS